MPGLPPGNGGEKQMKTALTIYRKETNKPGVFSYSMNVLQASEQGAVLSQYFVLISGSLYESLRGIKPEEFSLETKSYSVVF